MKKHEGTASKIFKPTDILVSRTDKRGVIQSANAAFVQVSGLSWEQLENAPHKIIRHVGTPKGVFWHMWDRLQANEPVGAFVKNQSDDGSYYWVFATVTPLDDGYMSVRIHPNGTLFEKAISLYESRIEAETKGDVTPEQSARALIEDIKNLGFHDYKAFMTKSLLTQIDHRDEALGVPHDTGLIHMSNAIDAWDRVYLEVQATIDAFKRFERLPANMRIQAAHLSRDGIPLGVIASNFSALSDQIAAITCAFQSGGAELEARLLDGLFLKCVRRVQNDVLDDCSRAGNSMYAVNKRAEIDIMDAQNKRYHAKVHEALAAILPQISAFAGLFSSIKALHSGISVTKVMADIEVAKIGVAQSSSLSAIVLELAQFLDAERERLHRMIGDVDKIGMEVQRAIDSMASETDAGSTPAQQSRRAELA